MEYFPVHHRQLYEETKHLEVPVKEIHEYIMSVPYEDGLLFHKWTGPLAKINGFRGDCLDKYGNPIPYCLGPHSIKMLRAVADMFKPKAILEIGFNLGYSSAMWLNLTDATVLGVDISDKDETLFGAEYLKEHYPGRFEFVLSDSKLVYDKIKDRKFDMIFIDGGHDEPDVDNDIALGVKLGIKKFAFDDWWRCWGPGVQSAIAKSPLNLTHVFSNIAVGTL